MPVVNNVECSNDDTAQCANIDKSHSSVDTHEVSMSSVGRLRDHIDDWEVCGANEFVLNIIREGYTFP